MLADLQGLLERVTFYNEENGYTIAKVKVHGRPDLVTVVGCLMCPTPGEVLKMRGEWANHPKFGEQFKIVQYQCQTPATVYGIQKYLGSGLIKGIGPVMAKRIVAVFGKDTLEVIENEPGRLSDVEGIGKKRMEWIRKAWEDQKDIREVMVFLQAHGVSSAYATRIFKRYGKDSIEVVKQNPYRLATDIFGIGFVTADRIAEKLGFAKDSALRAQAGVLYVLNELADEGHVFYPYEPLIEKSREILGVDREVIVRAVADTFEAKQIVIEDLNENLEEFRENNKAVYLTGYHFAETNVAARIRAILKAGKSVRSIDADKVIDWVQKQLSISLAEKQIEAVKASVAEKILVITGGPGTGKTTIINAILKVFGRLKVDILLAAPTGRAAKRMAETTGHEAKTIHRLLEFKPQAGGFQKNSDNRLECDLLILDETSMVDILLMHHLLKAVPATATLILVGDVNQLPSVGPGSVLGDIIGSQAVRVVELNEIFRQAQDSDIIVNAHRINQGQMPAVKPKDAASDFYFIEQADPDKTLATVIDLVKKRIPSRFGFDSLADIQVLTPMHRGTVGAGNLNTELQSALNPGEIALSRGSRGFKVSDKVMQIRNNYDKEVFNGDIGLVRKIDLEARQTIIEFDGREVEYDLSDLDEVVLAYAVSINKSQGSEYPAVVTPILTQHYVLLQRNLWRSRSKKPPAHANRLDAPPRRCSQPKGGSRWPAA